MIFDERQDEALLTGILSNLSFGGWAGPLLVLGSPPAAIWNGVRACASSVTHLGVPAADPQALAPVPIIHLEAGDDWLPGACAIIWEDEEPLAFEELERLFAATAEGSPILGILRTGPGQKRRRGLLEAACHPDVDALENGNRGCVLLGYRRSWNEAEIQFELEDPADVAVIILADGRPQGLARLLCDVLVCQACPAEQVFIMDLHDPGNGESRPVPEDLMGFSGPASGEVYLVPIGGVTPGEALNDALAAVRTPWTLILTEEDRLAPNALWLMKNADYQFQPGWMSPHTPDGNAPRTVESAATDWRGVLHSTEALCAALEDGDLRSPGLRPPRTACRGILNLPLFTGVLSPALLRSADTHA